MPGFEWKEDYLLRVDVHPYFLNLPFNRDFASEVTAMKGTDSLYAGLTEKGIAAETFAHALFYYPSEETKHLHSKIESIYNSTSVIDIASKDHRIGTFEKIWDVIRYTKGYVFNYDVFKY